MITQKIIESLFSTKSNALLLGLLLLILLFGSAIYFLRKYTNLFKIEDKNNLSITYVNNTFSEDAKKTIMYSWLFAPLFIDAGNMGGITIPVPGVFFLVPVIGQLAAFFTVIAHPILLLGSILLFNLYLVFIIRWSRKIIKDVKFFRKLFVILMCVPYWILASVILNRLIEIL